MVTRNVTAPEPSRCTSNASKAVPGTIREGLRPMTRSSQAMNGFSIPASVMMPKKRMANTNMPITPEMVSMPASMNFPVRMPKPPQSDARTGIEIRATTGDILLLRIAAMSTRMVRAPRTARNMSG